MRVNFEKFRVVKADFDSKKIESGKATLEFDLSSIRTDSEERTVTIDNVKQKTGATSAADAKGTAHGQTRTYPITFELLDKKGFRIRIKGAHKFTRLGFGIGTDPAQNPEEQVGTDLTIQMVLTLAKP